MINFTTCANVANSFLKVLQGYTKGIRFIALLTMLCTIGVGQMWGAEYTIAFLTAESDGSTEITSSTKTSTVLASGSCDYVKAFTSNCSKAYYKGKSGVKLSSSKASGTLEFNLADLCKVNVSKIVINTVKYSNEASTVAFYAGSTSLGSVSSGNTFTHDFDSPQEVASIKITSTKRSYISSITITTYEDAGGSDPDEPETPEKTATSLRWSAASYTATVGETNTFPTLTTTPADLTGVTYTSSNTSVATINASTGAITLVAAGSTTITASYAGNETYEAATDASYTLTVSAAQGGGDDSGDTGGCTWQLVTDASTLKANDEVIIAASGENNYALSTNQKSSNREGTAITKSGNTLSEPSADVQVLTLEAGSSTGTWAFYTGNSGYLYAASSSGNQLKTKTTLDVNGSWTISISNGVASIVATGSSNRNVMQYNPNNGSPIFACYASATQTSLALYKKVCSSGGGDPEPETPATELTNDQFAWSAATAEATIGASNTFPTLTNTLPVSVTYESSTPTTATIDATSGAVTLVAPGTTTISATFAGGEVSGTTYAAKTVTYALTVKKAPLEPIAGGVIDILNQAWTDVSGTNYKDVAEKTAENTGHSNAKYVAQCAGDKSSIQLRSTNSNSGVVSTVSGGVVKRIEVEWHADTDAARTLQIYGSNTAYTAATDLYGDAKGELLGELNKGEGETTLDFSEWTGDYKYIGFRSKSGAMYLTTLTITWLPTISKVTIDDQIENGSVSVSGAADLNSVAAGTVLTLSNTPATNYYKLSAYDVYKTGDETTKVTVTDGQFVMPEFNVTISATFVPVKTLRSIEITTAATQTTFWQGETFNHTGLVVTAHFDGAADEVVTPTVTGSTATAGTQTVTVSYTEGTTTKTATYTITVKAIPNTKETAYSVADAYDIIDKLTTAEGVFISGIISQVDSYNSTYKSITYWISADGTTTNQLEVYSGKGLESADFTAVTDLSVGDQVIVCGNLKLYNEIYEFDKNNYLAAYTPTTKDPAGLAYATTEYTVNLGEEFATPVLTNPNGLTVTYSTSDASKATVDANTGAVTVVAAGTVTITASTIGDATHDAGTASYTITIIDPYENIARLPFTYNSGKAAIETTAGITHSGLGSDYTTDGVPPLKFDTEGDNVIINFDSEPGEFSFILKQNGSNAGTFTVYESSNGEDYTPVWTGGDLGNAQSATITPTLAAASRYVKFEYTTKPSGTNYGLGNISIQKPDLRADAGLVWNPNSVTLTKGDAFTAPTLSNPNSVSGITYESSNTDVATVTDAGVIALAGATGEATITATFAGDATYKRATATCTIIVNAIPALTAPTGLTVTDLTCSSVTLSWNAVTNATGYEVVRTLGSNTTYNTTETSITIDNLDGGKENSWKVRAIGDDISYNNSEYTIGEKFTTLFSVKYYVDGVIWHGCDNGCVANGGSFEICETVPTKANYDFAGWATSAGGEVAYQAGETTTNIADNVTLHAVWSDVTYTVNWSVNGQDNNVTYTHGQDLVLPTIDIEPCDGMDHVGWTDQLAYRHGTDKLFTEASGTVTSDTTYYAVFATKTSSDGGAETTLDFSQKGYTNGDAISSATEGKITVTFDKGTNASNAPKYYTTGTAIRAYGGNTITVSSENTISNIVITFSTGDDGNAITASNGSYTDGINTNGTYSNGTWTGSANSITFTVDGSSGHRRIQSIAVTSTGNASYYTDYTTTCEGRQLETPTNLNTTDITHNSATLTWDEVAGTRSYKVVINGNEYTTNTNSYSAHSLKSKTDYTWTVQAIGNGTTFINSDISAEATFTTEVAVTITWIAGANKNSNTITYGQSIGQALGELPTPETPDGCKGKAFMGWTTTRKINSDGTNIEYIDAEIILTENTTFYAVFAATDIDGATDVTDVLTHTINGKESGTTYNAFTDKEYTSDARYAGSSANGNSAIQLRSTNNSGIVTTTSGGSIKSITVEWDSNNTAEGRTLDIYGKNTAYSEASDLYDTNTQGAKLGSIINGTSTSLTIDGNYQYIGLRSKSGAMYLTSITIEWQSGEVTYTEYSTSCGDFLVTYYGFNTGGYTTICGDNPGEITVPQFDTYTIPTCTPTEDPQGLNRTFAGTWVDDKGNSHKPGDSFEVTDDITLYAQWTWNTNTIPTDDEGIGDLATTDIVVTGGNTLTLQAGTTTINSLTLKGGLQENGSYAMPVVNIPEGATLVRNNNKINLDLKVNNNSYYPFAVPFEVENTAANVNYINPTLKEYANANKGYGKYYRILEYNGALRAENGVNSNENWVHVGRSNNEKLVPGKGYAISAVPASGQDTVTIRIAMTVDNAWLADGEQESITVKEQTTTRNQIAVEAHTGTATDINNGGHQRHAGWNFVANPYLTNFAGTNASNKEGAFINGEILINNGEYSYGGEDVPYVTIPTYNFAHYYQQQLSEATLSPAYGFFVQVGTSGTMDFTTTGRQQAPASITARNAEERPVKMDVDITLSDNHSSDQTGLIISDRYSEAYEIGRDLEKLFGSAYNLSVYTLMADNTPLAFQALAIRSNMQVIPVGYRAPEQGEYTFRLNEATSSIDLLNEQYEQLVLVDYQTGELTNLLIADYTFYSERVQSDSRFALYAVPRQNAPTDLPNAIGQDKQAQKIIHNGHLYILRDGNVYNGNGQIVK